MKGALAITVAISVVASSCQSIDPRAEGQVAITTATTAADREPVAWVLSGVNASIYLQWTDDSGQLAGVAHVAERNAEGTAVDLHYERLVGATNGGQVVLTAQTQRWSGASTIDTLVLSWARAEGWRQEITLRVGTAADFDAAVASMHSELTSTSTAAATIESAGAATTTEVSPADAVEGAIVELRVSADGLDVSDVEAALDVMEAFAGQVGGGICATTLVEMAALQDVAATVELRLRTVDSLTDQIERQRAILDVLSVAYGDSPDVEPSVVDAATDTLTRADRYVEDRRAYAGDVRAVVVDALADARATIDDC